MLVKNKSMFTIEHVPSHLKPRFEILALGTDTRQRISWAQKGKIFSLTPKQEFAYPDGFIRAASRFVSKRFGLSPRIIAFDPHPFFACGQEAGLLKEKYFPKCILKPIFHHTAHVANFGIEVSPKKRFIGVAFDGTGFGPDRHVWGGEFFIYDLSTFKRVAYLEEQPLPGNESAIKEPWRMAFAILYKIYGKKIYKMHLKFLQNVPSQKLKLVAQMLDKNFNAPFTSSAGRLFDAASALLDIKPVVSQEAEAAIALEKAAAHFAGKTQPYGFKLKKKNGFLVIDTIPAFRQMVEDLQQKKSVFEMAHRFHLTMTEVVWTTCTTLKKRLSIDHVYCSGGVFMNNILTEELSKRAVQNRLKLYFAKRPTTTDLGISQGQIAAVCMERNILKTQ